MQCCQKLKSPKSRQIWSAPAVNNLKVARFFIKLKCAQLSHFGRFYVANQQKITQLDRKMIDYPTPEVEDNHLRWLRMTS